MITALLYLLFTGCYVHINLILSTLGDAIRGYALGVFSQYHYLKRNGLGLSPTHIQLTGQLAYCIVFTLSSESRSAICFSRATQTYDAT